LKTHVTEHQAVKLLIST